LGTGGGAVAAKSMAESFLATLPWNTEIWWLSLINTAVPMTRIRKETRKRLVRTKADLSSKGTKEWTSWDVVSTSCRGFMNRK
jgi:hypothetical protein